MNRRLFIRMGTWASLMISFTPSSLFKASGEKLNQKSILVDLPKVKKHIRHGLLSNQDLSKTSIHWLTQYQKDVFLRDGLQESSSDLTHVSMKIQGEILNLGIQKNSFFITRQDTTQSIPFDKNSLSEFYSDGEYIGKIIKLDQPFSFDNETHIKETVIIPIIGNIKTNDQIIDNDAGILLQNISHISIIPKTESIVLILQKKELEDLD